MRLLPAFIVLIAAPSVVSAQAGPVGGSGRYVIVHSPHIQRDTVLLDTVTGKTWQMQTDSSREGDPVVWTPLARTDNLAEVVEHNRKPLKAK